MKDKNVPGNPQIPSPNPLRSIKDKALTSMFSFAAEGTAITLGGPPLVTWPVSLTSKLFHVAFLGLSTLTSPLWILISQVTPFIGRNIFTCMLATLQMFPLPLISALSILTVLPMTYSISAFLDDLTIISNLKPTISVAVEMMCLVDFLFSLNSLYSWVS